MNVENGLLRLLSDQMYQNRCLQCGITIHDCLTTTPSGCGDNADRDLTALSPVTFNAKITSMTQW
jgi:hypothetical protein